MRSRPVVSHVLKLALVVMVGSVAAACSSDDESGQVASSTVVVTAAPATTYDVDETMDGVREEVVRLVMERDGVDRAAAEAKADELMERGVDTEAVDQQMALFANWMEHYRAHPVLGRHWTEDEAECAVVTMIQVEGLARTGALMNGASVGGMSPTDALSLVQPVGYCTDLVALMHADMTDLGVPRDPDCLLADVTEEDVARWFVARFTHGREGFNAAMAEDIDLTCPSGS